MSLKAGQGQIYSTDIFNIGGNMKNVIRQMGRSKFLSVLFLIVGLTTMGWGQTSFTATYTFGGDGDTISFAYNGTTYDGITPGNIVKDGVTTSSSTGNFRASNWPTGATDGNNTFTGSVDLGKYIGFTIDVVSGYKMTITSITFGVGRSGTGTRQCQWRGSADSYGSILTNYTTLNADLTNESGVLTNPDSNYSWTGNVLEVGSAFTDITNSAGFRFYLYNAESTVGTAGLQGAITISGTFENIEGTPIITVDPSSLTGFSYVQGSGPSAEQSFTISGSDLIADISIIPPLDYEISTGTGDSFSATNPITLTQSGGTVSETNIYVRLKAGLSGGNYSSEDITASSTGANNKTVTCSGRVLYAPLADADYVEDFSNSNATASYADNSFVGNDWITWYYVQSRNENNDANNSGIDGKALMLRYITGSSKVYSSPVPGGIADFYVRLYKGFTGAGDRQVELFVNNVTIGTSIAFDDYDEHIFTVSGINISGDVVIELRNTTAKQVIVDDISWTSYDANYVQEEIATGTNVSQAFTGTNVTLEFGEVTTGANVRTSKYDYAPQNVSFVEPAPLNYSDYKLVINGGDLVFSDGVIKIAIDGLAGITNPSTVDIYKRSTPGSGAFEKLTTSYADGFLSAAVSSFSEFILGSNDEDNSLPVSLQNFYAVPGSGKVTINWITESETENLGFNLYRSTKASDQFSVISDQLIPGHGSCSEMHKYSYVDRDVVNGVTYFYKLEDVDYAGKTELHNKVVSATPKSKESDASINQFRLYSCYPNPFNPETTLRFELTEAARISVQIYDLLGNRITTLSDAAFQPGVHKLTWSGRDHQNRLVGTGIYFLRISNSAGFSSTQKVVFLR